MTPPSAPKGERGGEGLSVSPLSVAGLSVLFALFLLWYWGIEYSHLVYITHYFDVPRASFLCSPGGAVRFLGDIPSLVSAWFRTDFLGAVLIVFFSILPAVGMLTAARFGRTGRYSPLWVFALLPTALLTVLTSVQGYYHFSAVRTGEFYGTFLALGGAVLLPGFCRLFKSRARVIVEIAALALFYPLFGIFTFPAALYIAREEYLSRGAPHRARRVLIPMITAAVLPILCIPLCASRVAPSALWTAGSIHFPKHLLDSGTYLVSARLYIAVLVSVCLPLIFTALAAAKEIMAKSPKKAPPRSGASDASQEGKDHRVRRLGKGDILSLAAVAVLAAGIWHFSKTDENYMALLASVRALEYDRWDDLLEIEGACAEPTLPLIELRRLALAETGRIGQELFDRPNLPVTSPDLQTSRTLALLGADMAMRSGSVNFAFWKSCELLRVFPESPYYRWLVFQCALIDGGPVSARKCLELLRPMKRPDWVAAGEDILEAVKHQTEPKTQTGRRVLARVKLADSLRPQEFILNNNSVSRVLQESAMHRDFAGCPLSAQERFLSWLLLVRDFDRFADNFDIYYKHLQQDRPGAPIPHALQQGAIIVEYYQTEEYPVHRYPYDRRLVERFAEFLAINARLNQNQGDAAAEAERMLRASFPLSYWSYQQFIFDAPDY